MIILFIILFCVAVYGIKFASFHKDYMTPSSTNAIKGIFAVLILYSHMRGYLTLSDACTGHTYVRVLKYLGQTMTTMYLFYSGYGLMESVRTKPGYGKNFFRKRILKILLHFDIAVLMYIILQFLLGWQFDGMTYLASLVGWESVGNSNWFIFEILVLYLFFYFGLWIKRKVGMKYASISVGVIILATTIVLSVFLWLFLHKQRDGSWWIDNIFTFSLGMGYSLVKDKIDDWMRNGKVYFPTFIVLTMILVGWRHVYGVDMLGVCTCLFALWAVMLTMKVKLDNRVLQWLGTVSFSVYILQRIPMILLTAFGINSNIALFVSITIPSAFLLAYLYTGFLKKVDSKLFV